LRFEVARQIVGVGGGQPEKGAKIKILGLEPISSKRLIWQLTSGTASFSLTSNKNPWCIPIF
jgi:hypothetical protein